MTERRTGEIGMNRNTVDETEVNGLAARLEGEILTAEDPGYDEARAVWNGMIDRRPELIVRCAEAGDIFEAIAFARERLAHYKAPSSIDVVEALPRNPSGKILKRDLRKAYWADRDRQV